MALGIALLNDQVSAADAPYIAVGSAKTKKTVVAFPDVLGVQTLGREITTTVTNDLSFMDLFKFLPSSAFLEKAGVGITLDKFKLSDWTSIGAEFLLKASVEYQGANILLEAHLYDAFGG